MSAIKAKYLLLFFNNPGCTSCGEIIAHIQDSPLMNTLEEEKKLRILAVYPDEDLAEWLDYQDKMPERWINGYDSGTVIKTENLYDLKAIPSLYLLDRDKTVLLKDVNIHRLESYLEQNALKH